VKTMVVIAIVFIALWILGWVAAMGLLFIRTLPGSGV
jgi:hypothetical protein